MVTVNAIVAGGNNMWEKGDYRGKRSEVRCQLLCPCKCKFQVKFYIKRKIKASQTLFRAASTLKRSSNLSLRNNLGKKSTNRKNLAKL